MSILFVFGQSFDTLDCGFLEHLEVKKQYQEKFLYLQKTKLDSNYKNIENAWLAYKLCNYVSASNFFSNTHQTLVYASGYEPIYSWTKAQSMTSNQQKAYFKNKLDNGKKGELYKMFSLYSPKEILFDSFGLIIQKRYIKYYIYDHKNTFVAASLATLIPGLGKMYIGKSKDGLNALLMVSFLGVQAVESYLKSGPTNWRTLIFGSLAVSFHTANIYGTIKSLKKTKKESRNEFLKSIDEEYLYHISHYSICR
ncbi:MAG: hypothetical protein U0V72_07495 [Cytophagales bacterium]